MAKIVIEVADDQYDGILNAYCDVRGFGNKLQAFANLTVKGKEEKTKEQFVTEKLTEDLVAPYKGKIRVDEHEKVEDIIKQKIDAIDVTIDLPVIKLEPVLTEEPIEEEVVSL